MSNFVLYKKVSFMGGSTLYIRIFLKGTFLIRTLRFLHTFKIFKGYHVSFLVPLLVIDCYYWSSFHCDSGDCVNSMYECDGYDNCGDNSDEQNCG